MENGLRVVAKERSSFEQVASRTFGTPSIDSTNQVPTAHPRSGSLLHKSSMILQGTTMVVLIWPKSNCSLYTATVGEVLAKEDHNQTRMHLVVVVWNVPQHSTKRCIQAESTLALYFTK